MTERFRIFGHRGSPRRFPENTVASFEETLRAGADGFETDLRILSDGSLVLFHDDELAEEEIESLSFDQCAARGASMARVAELAQFAGRTTMILEVKRGGWEEVLMDVVAEWPNCVIASFDHSIIASLRKRGIVTPLGITVFGTIAGVAEYAAGIGATWCFPAYRFVSEEMVASLHARDIKVVPWSPNRPAEWARLRSMGCDGIITDLPAEAVVWRDTVHFPAQQ